ncbi:MAG: ribonuclease Z [Bacteroidales bacterium]
MPVKLTILGSSSALPTSERNPSAHVLNVHERYFLIDCGEGTQMQLRRNRIRFSKIHDIFISHLHGDHVFGLYGLLSTLSLLGRKIPLNLYAPQNYGILLKNHLADFDIHLSYEINFIPLSGKDPVTIYDDKYMSVTSFPLDHRVPSFGFLFREKPGERKIRKEAISSLSIPLHRIRSIKGGADYIDADGKVIKNDDITEPGPDPVSYAYCSDTRYFKRLPTFFKNVTLLYHEATFDSDKHELAKITGHSTTTDAAKVALEAGAGTLVIGHFSSRYKATDNLVTEASAIFPRTFAATEGKTYDLSDLNSL